MTRFELHGDMETFEARVRISDASIPAGELLNDPGYSEGFKERVRYGLRQFNLLESVEARHD